MSEAKVVLTKLEVDEGSLVPAGDNPAAHVVLTKAAPTGVLARLKAWASGVWKNGGEGEAPKTTGQVLTEQQFVRDFMDLKLAFMDSVGSILEGAPTEKTGAMLRVSVEEFATRAKALIDSAGMGSAPSAKAFSGLVDSMRAAALAEAQGDVSKRKGFAEAASALDELRLAKDGGTIMKTLAEILGGLSPEDKQTVEAALTAAKAPENKMGAGCEPGMSKAASAEPPLPEAVQKALDTALAKAKAAEEELAKMKASARSAEFVAKARALDVPGQDADKLGAILLKAADAGLDTDLITVLTALTAQVKANDQITKTIGARGGGTEAADAEARVQKAADALRAADPKLSPQQAFVKALEKDKALAKETLDATR